MFIPANDWAAIDPLHTYMAMTRAIENGLTLVRPAGQGLSVAADNSGRVLASMDFYKTTDQIMYAEVPIQRSWTFYGWAGDYLPILCLVILAFLILRRILQSNNKENVVLPPQKQFAGG